MFLLLFPFVTKLQFQVQRNKHIRIAGLYVGTIRVNVRRSLISEAQIFHGRRIISHCCVKIQCSTQHFTKCALDGYTRSLQCLLVRCTVRNSHLLKKFYEYRSQITYLAFPVDNTKCHTTHYHTCCVAVHDIRNTRLSRDSEHSTGNLGNDRLAHILFGQILARLLTVLFNQSTIVSLILFKISKRKRSNNTSTKN